MQSFTGQKTNEEVNASRIGEYFQEQHDRLRSEAREGEDHSKASGDLVLYTDQEARNLVKKLSNYGLEYQTVRPVQF